MKKLFLSAAMVMTAALGAFAQDSFETALTLQTGANASTAYQVDYYKGAYFKYTASENTVLAVTSVNGSGIYFYNEDHSGNYDASSSYDEYSVATYALAVSAGQTIYVFANQGYGDTSDEVNCMVAIHKSYGDTTADAPVVAEDGQTYWFGSKEGYLSYTAAEDGVLVLTQSGYDNATTSTVDGVTTNLTDNDHKFNLSVTAGKTYLIHTSNYYSPFSMAVQFTQPKQGDILENPFILAIGNNNLPKGAQKYYYKFTNDEDAGFLNLTIPGGVVLSARTVGSSWDNLLGHAEGTARITVDMDQEIIIIADRSSEAESDGVLVAEYKTPEAGETEALAIAITSSDAVSTAAGQETYYSIKNETGVAAQLFVNVITEGISSYGTSTVTVKAKGASYGQTIGTGDEFKQECTAGTEYIIVVKNNSESPIEFSAWVKALEAGDSYNKPIAAVLGQNEVAAAGQKFYSYTATKECKLSITVGNKETTTLFFPNSAGDEYTGIDGVTSKDGEYTLAATAGNPVIFRMTGAAAGETFTIAEQAYGPGETRATAIEMTSNVIELGDLAPYKTWYVYSVAKDGVAELVPANFAAPTWEDNVYYAVNDGYEANNNLRGYAADYSYIFTSATTSVTAGDKIYIRLDVKQLNEGATVTINVKEPEHGELALLATDGEKNYATFSSDRAVIITSAEAQVYTVNVTDGKISLDSFYTSSYTNSNAEYVSEAYYVPAGTGVLIVSDKESVSYTYGASSESSVYAPIEYNTNLLKAASVAMEAGYAFYKLAYNNYTEKSGLGFFYGAANGAAFQAKENGAYLAVPASMSEAKGFLLNGADVDAIQSIAVENKAAQGIFNLQGQRVQKLQKGINIVNGRKVIY